MSNLQNRASACVQPHASSEKLIPVDVKGGSVRLRDKRTLSNQGSEACAQASLLWIQIRLMHLRLLCCLPLVCLLLHANIAYAQSCGIVCENSLPGDSGWDAGS